MLHIRKQRLETARDIQDALSTATRLELATLPPYMTALYSIKPGHNVQIANVLRSVVMEEMLHFCLACNILNAIGGRPTINTPGFVPPFPGPLPGDIGVKPDGKPFKVPLRRFSLELVREVFMTIEEPEDPIAFSQRGPEARNYHTIGEFYEAIKQALIKGGKKLFTGDPSRQVTGHFGENVLFAVKDVDSASQAIDLIIEQGEGTRKSPLDIEGRLAHYYLFAEIVHGRRLVRSATDRRGWAYDGDSIPFDANGVFPMVDDPTKVRLPRTSIVSQYADRFDRTFTTLLNALHETVNGDPDHLGSSVGVMFSLRLEAQQLMATPIPGTNVHAGPRWRYVPGP